MANITINGISLDPARESQQLTALSLASADAKASDYILIQVKGPLGAKEKQALKSKGAIILEYVPENCYICHYSNSELSGIRALPFVEWVNVYLRDFKVDRQLLEPAEGQVPTSLTALSASAVPAEEPDRQVDIVLHRDVDAASIRDKIASIAGLDPSSLADSRGKIRAFVSGRRLADLAALDEVRHIEVVYEASFANDKALEIMHVDKVHLRNPGFEGDGQVVAVCDTGFDRGNTSSVHPAFTGRVNRLYALGRSQPDDPHGHGTHVAGSVLGDGVANNYGKVRGAAPAARLVLQSVLDASGGLGGLPADLNHLFDPTYVSDEARVHNNSWGTTNSNGRYTQSSFEVDEFVWKHRDMVVCFAAGNPGRDANANGVIDLGSVQAPGTAKNCLTVGASENLRPDKSQPWGTPWPSRYPAEPIRSDLWADDPSGMAAFSGRGPTKDGRIKPDVVAPGTSILSAHSHNANVGSFWGTAPEPRYCYMGGTSMATPLTAGCAAVVREFLLKDRQLGSPSAALVKAMLINGAVDLAGQYTPSEAGPPPNFSEGFGRVDLANTLLLDRPDSLELMDEGVELDAGDEETYTYNVPAGAELIKATLVWTDPPGETLQNDLDLIVKGDEEERHGNVPPGSNRFDRTNNVEQVVWQYKLPSSIEVIVRAHRVPLHPQSFALVLRFV